MFSRLNISARLMAGFGLLVAAIIALAVFATSQFESLGDYAALSQKRSAVVIGMKDSYLNVRQARVMAWSYAATGDSGYLKSRDDAFSQAHVQLQAVRNLLMTDEGRRLVKAFEDSIVDFEAKARTFSDLKAKGVDFASPEFQASIADMNAGAKRYAETNNAASAYVERLNSDTAKDVNNRIDWASNAAIVAGVVGTLIGMLIAWLIGRGITGPINGLRGAMERLAGNELTVEVPGIARHDEIGAMARTVEVFKDSMIRTRRLEQEAKDAEAQAAAGKRQATLDLARTFEERVGSIVNAVGSSATELQATSSQLAAAVEEVGAQCSTVAAASEQASANVQTVAAASEQLSASIGELSERVGRAADRSKLAAEGAGEAQRQLDVLSASIEQVDQIVASINAVASQTNLLALNATIEAARAGEAGKGFAVVASEVKNLANQTHAMTEQIANQIGAVKAASGRTVGAMRTIIGQVEEISSSTADMAQSVSQQSGATAEISRNAQQAAVGTTEVSRNVLGIQQAENETAAASNNVKHASDDLARQSATLKQVMDSFLTDLRAA